MQIFVHLKMKFFTPPLSMRKHSDFPCYLFFRLIHNLCSNSDFNIFLRNPVMLSLIDEDVNFQDFLHTMKRYRPHTTEWLQVARLASYLMLNAFVVVWVGIGYTAFSRKSGDIIQPRSQCPEEKAFVLLFAVIGLIATVFIEFLIRFQR